MTKCLLMCFGMHNYLGIMSSNLLLFKIADYLWFSYPTVLAITQARISSFNLFFHSLAFVCFYLGEMWFTFYHPFYTRQHKCTLVFAPAHVPTHIFFCFGYNASNDDMFQKVAHLRRRNILIFRPFAKAKTKMKKKTRKKKHCQI